MPADLTRFGAAGRLLVADGWKVVVTGNTPGSASVNTRDKTIRIKPAVARAAANPASRASSYVLRHEVAHAVHDMLLDQSCDELEQARNLTHTAALECVADTWCLYEVPTRQMRRWVRSSVIWHGRIGRRYRWSDVTSLEAWALVDLLHCLAAEREAAQ